MAVVAALLARRAGTDDGLAADQAGFASFGTGSEQCLLDGLGIVAVHIGNDMPAVGFEALRRVIGEPAFDVAVDRDAVVVPESDQLAQAERAGERAGLVGDAFHQAAVTEESVGVVVDDAVTGAVELGCQYFLGQREADSVGDALTQWAGGCFNPGGVAEFRVARRAGM